MAGVDLISEGGKGAGAYCRPILCQTLYLKDLDDIVKHVFTCILEMRKHHRGERWHTEVMWLIEGLTV
jgi:hypothetical protein